MVIGVNARFLLKGKLEGIGWFCFEVLKRWVANHPEHQFIFFFDRPFDESFIFGPNVKGVNVFPPARSRKLWDWWFNWSIPKQLKKHNCDVFVSMDGYCSLKTDLPQLMVIHDLAFEHDSFGLAQKFIKYYRNKTPLFAKKANRIATVSEFSKKDICQKYSIEPSSIDVVYDGFNESFTVLSFEEKIAIQKEYAEGKEYFLFVGAIHPRKNVERLIKAFDSFKQQTTSDMKLLVVGRNAWGNNSLNETLEGLIHKEDIVWLGHLPFEKVKAIVGGAFALAYISLFEGFGIPILEALACDVPVITSSTSSMPEVAGEAGIIVDPLDVEAIKEAMNSLASNKDLRTTLIEKGKVQKEKFSWDKTAESLWHSLEKIEL